MSKTPGREPPWTKIKEFDGVGLTRRFWVEGATNADDALAAVSGLAPEGSKHPDDKASEAARPIVIGRERSGDWRVAVQYWSDSSKSLLDCAPEPAVEQAPTTAYEWANLTGRLAHVRLSSPKDSHSLTLEEMGIRVKGGDRLIPIKVDAPCPIYHPVAVDVGLDALVTGVTYRPPNDPPGDKEKLFPHGYLSLTVDVFLDGPIGVHAQEITKREPA